MYEQLLKVVEGKILTDAPYLEAEDLKELHELRSFLKGMIEMRKDTTYEITTNNGTVKRKIHNCFFNEIAQLWQYQEVYGEMWHFATKKEWETVVEITRIEKAECYYTGGGIYLTVVPFREEFDGGKDMVCVVCSEDLNSFDVYENKYAFEDIGYEENVDRHLSLMDVNAIDSGTIKAYKKALELTVEEMTNR